MTETLHQQSARTAKNAAIIRVLEAGKRKQSPNVARLLPLNCLKEDCQFSLGFRPTN